MDFLIFRRMESQAYATNTPRKNQSTDQKKPGIVMTARES